MQYLIKRLNRLLEFDIQAVDLPFVWDKKNNKFLEFINEDMEYLRSIIIRNTYKWSKVSSVLIESVSIKKIASDLRINERSVRRWRQGTRNPSIKYIPYLIKMSKLYNIDISQFEVNNVKR